jgi:hypothetical protein
MFVERPVSWTELTTSRSLSYLAVVQSAPALPLAKPPKPSRQGRWFPKDVTMQRDALAREAKECRDSAPMYAGRPEQPFLLKLATAFETLARHEGEPSMKREVPLGQRDRPAVPPKFRSLA